MGLEVRTIAITSIAACRFAIFAPEHYRRDGTCRCDDLAHRKKMMREWGYKKKDFKGIPLREKGNE